jgi:hypothetical protein
MYYSITRPKDAVAASILDAAIESLRLDAEMQADLARLSRTCLDE